MITSDERNEKALKVAEEIVAMKARLATLVEEFKSLVGNGNASNVQRAATGTEQDSPSAASRILAVFTRQPGKKIAVQEVVNELSDIDATLVRSTVNRMGRTGKLKKLPSRGFYKFIPTDNGESGEG